MGGAPAPRTTPGPAAPTAARGANARSQPRTVEVGPAPRSGHLLPVPPRPMPGAPARHRQAGRQGREAVAEKTPVKRNCVRPVVRRHPYGEPDAGGPVPGWHWRPGINLEDSLLLTRAGGPDDTSRPGQLAGLRSARRTLPPVICAGFGSMPINTWFAHTGHSAPTNPAGTRITSRPCRPGGRVYRTWVPKSRCLTSARRSRPLDHR